MNSSRPLAAAMLALLALPATPAGARATFPLQPGELVVTCKPFGGTGGPVVGVVDVRDPPCHGAVLGMNWLAPMYHNELPNPTRNPADEWTEANLGDVFGVTLDDASPPNIYVTASSVWGLQSGKVWKLGGSDGRIQLFATLPNTGPALGNIAYDRAHKQLFVTDMEDGKLYRLDMTGATLDTFDPFQPDDGTAGFAPLGERLWAVGVHDYRVYFSVWAEDTGRVSLSSANSIWSVGLDPATGDFVPADLTLEIEMPPLGTNTSNPVTDLAFADDDWLIVAERVMTGDTVTGAHSARVLEFGGGHLGWGLSSRWFSVGSNFPVPPPSTNSAGGIDYDCPVVDGCNSGRRVWVMGDLIKGNIYGLEGLPETGGAPDQSYLIDLDGDVSSTNAKTYLGCVEVYRPVCSLKADAGPPVEFCGTAASVTLDASKTAGSGCGTAIEYRWFEGATLLRDWSTSPTIVVTPSATTTYRLESRCGRCPCFDTVAVTITVWPDVVPGSLGNTLLEVRQGTDVVFSWGPGAESKSFVLYRATVKNSWPPAPLVSGLAAPAHRLNDVPPPPPLYFYRVAGVSCTGREGP